MLRGFIGCIAILLSSMPSISFADWPPDSPGPKLPFAIHWDAGRKDNVLTEEFIAKEHRIYTFSIAFRYVDRKPSADDFKKLKIFTGDSSSHRVTKGSAGTEHPVQVDDYTEDEKAFMHRGGSLVGGAYYKTHPLRTNQRYHEDPPNTVVELTQSGKGVIIPIHIKVERADKAKGLSIIFEETLMTQGIASGGSFGLERTIADVALRPGTYRVTVNATQDVTFPDGIETLLLGSWDPKKRVLREGN